MPPSLAAIAILLVHDRKKFSLSLFHLKRLPQSCLSEELILALIASLQGICLNCDFQSEKLVWLQSL
jgi:hypothetical protein